MGTPKEQIMDHFKQQIELGRSLNFVPTLKKSDEQEVQKFLDSIQEFIDQGCPIAMPSKELVADLKAFFGKQPFEELKEVYGKQISMWQYMKDNLQATPEEVRKYSTENPYIFD